MTMPDPHSDPQRETERYRAARDALRDVVGHRGPPTRRELRQARRDTSWWRRTTRALKLGRRDAH